MKCVSEGGNLSDRDEIGFGNPSHEPSDISFVPHKNVGAGFDDIGAGFQGGVQHFDVLHLIEGQVAVEMILDARAIGDELVALDAEVFREKFLRGRIVNAAHERQSDIPASRLEAITCAGFCQKIDIVFVV